MTDLAPTRPIRFYHRGQIVQVQGVDSTTSVLSWLREQARLTGTKEGCNEGDCGACTVLVGQLHTSDSGQATVQFKPINSCIQFLPSLDGKALITVEDLGGQHPAQQALVACHGSQCGFCTPGFVMSLAALRQNVPAQAPAPARQDVADALSGNLCRCTGYRPILDAGQQMFAAPRPELATPAMVQALQTLAADAALHYPAPTPYLAPRTLDQLAAWRLAKPQARLTAGTTDVGLWVNKQFRALGEVISLTEVKALQAIDEADGHLRIGAGASLEAAWAALARHWPACHEMGLRFASRPIREAGTLGGNVANGSPIGDGPPVLIALGATIVLQRGPVQREMPLQDFYISYGRNHLAEGEFVHSLKVPLPQAGDVLRVYKLSKRHDCDISSLAAGLWLRLHDGKVAQARWAWGGMDGIVRRSSGAEAAAVGQPWQAATVQAAMAALDADFKPLTDLRATASYRQRAARNLLQRLWLETRPEAPLPADQTTVWSA